jgi:hypothetical protein
MRIEKRGITRQLASFAFCAALGGSATMAGCTDDAPSVVLHGDASADDAAASIDAADGAAAPTDATGCGPAEQSCAGACVDVATDVTNCGACGTSCPDGDVCSVGQCALTCGGGTVKCGATCNDPKTDPSNCGGCGVLCGAGQVCSAGQCALSCGGATTMCGAACVDEKLDPAHCGGCGEICKAGQVCSNSTCQSACTSGLTTCGADAGAPYCANAQTDNANCGGCGITCAAGTACSSGHCGTSCGAGETMCTPDAGAAYCASVGSDNVNCGACGVVCGAGTACSSGHCGTTCGGNETMCTPDAGAAQCADLQSDPGNCGTCGTICASDACQAGECIVTPCGDGVIELALGETCDDGNHVNGDGCSSSCHVEPFVTVAPVKVSAALSCTTSVANAARKIAVDSSGTIYAGMTCGTDAYIVVSKDRGATFSTPLDLSADLPSAPVTISQVALATGPTGVGYLGLMASTGKVYLKVTTDFGATWGAASLVGTATSTTAGLSLQSFNNDIYIGFATAGGVTVAANHARGVGTFATTPVTISIAYFDLVFDVTDGTVAVCADTPSFHIRASSDEGVTFAAEVNPPGSEFYSDWAIGNGNIYVSGTSGGGAAQLFVIPTSALATSSSVSGLPVVTAAQTRSVAADAAGNAFVASQLNAGGVQLDRLKFGGTSFDTPRAISATGGSPIAAPLPGSGGAAVAYTDGTSVWVTIQAY